MKYIFLKLYTLVVAKECFDRNGVDYDGRINLTGSGKRCMSWI